MANTSPAYNGSLVGQQDDWIPLEWDDEVIMRVLKNSAVESLAERHTMATSTKRILRQQSYLVTAGKSYTPDEGDLDYVTLTARRFMGQSILDEDDTADAAMIVDTVLRRSQDWAISYFTAFDNACLGVTAAEDGTAAPFTSVYKHITTADTAAGYSANANLVQWNASTTASAAYSNLSATLRLVEDSDYWDEGQSLIIANPAYREVLRNVKDLNGTPIFVQGQGADSGQPDRLFGVEIFWSRGAKTSPAMSATPSGNPLLVFVGNRSLLKLGVRSGPETRMGLADAHSSVDEIAVKFRSRRGFQLGHVKGFAVLEKTG
jgi:HK97 family phage major capsid protein